MQLASLTPAEPLGAQQPPHPSGGTTVAGPIEELETHGALTAEQVADLIGSQAANRRQAAYRLAKDGKLFAVDWHGTRVYPAFQFDPQARHVRPQIAEVLAALAGELNGWELALWFDDAIHDPADRDYTVPLDVIDDAAHLVRLAEATVAQRRATGAA